MDEQQPRNPMTTAQVLQQKHPRARARSAKEKAQNRKVNSKARTRLACKQAQVTGFFARIVYFQFKMLKFKEKSYKFLEEILMKKYLISMKNV